MYKNQLAGILLFLFVSLLTHAQVSVPFNSKQITYMGRTETVDNENVKIYWPGTSVKLYFKGSEASVTMSNDKGLAIFYAIVDGDAQNAKKIIPDKTKTTIQLASNLPDGKHTVEIFKLTDNTTVTSFYGFELNEGAKVLKPNKPGKKKIEFYGNSITAGHGVDVQPGEPDSGAPEYFNNYLTYAARTARHYNAQYFCNARSGIGVMLSWFPEIMPEVYNRVDPFDAESKWDFSRFTPDIVVINLFQNDSWLINNPEHEQFKARFGSTKPDNNQIIKSYQTLVLNIRKEYPKASIICALGSMDATRENSPWPGYVEKAVEELNDSKIYTHFFKYKDTPGHPIAIEQKAMAESLIEFIDKNVKW
jgi:hypothetical protein